MILVLFYVMSLDGAGESMFEGKDERCWKLRREAMVSYFQDFD
jgi:hypothetical protein